MEYKLVVQEFEVDNVVVNIPKGAINIEVLPSIRLVNGEPHMVHPITIVRFLLPVREPCILMPVKPGNKEQKGRLAL